MSETLTFLMWLAKATALLVLAVGITAGLRRAPAGARYLVWLGTLVAILLVPAVSSWSPLPLRVLPAAGIAIVPVSPVVTPRSEPTPAIARVLESAGSSAVTSATVERRASPTTPQVIVVFWVAVAALLLGWLLLGALMVRRIVRGGRVLADDAWLSPMYDVADRLDLEHAPRLIMSSAIEMPFACGILRPTIVLPTSAEQWSTERRRVVLFHELAHVRRRDLLGHTLGRVVCALYWFHPLVWSAAKQLRAESERACDDLVLACGGARASEYANHLLEIVTSVRLQGAPATALPMANKREFEGRMLAILDPAIKRATPSRVQTASLTLGLAALSLTIAAVSPTRREPDVAAPQVAAAPVTRGDSSVTGVVRPLTDGAPGPSRLVAPAPRPAPAQLPSPQATNQTTQSTTNTTVKSLANTVTNLVTNTVTDLITNASRPGQPVDTALLGKILRTDKDAGVRKAAAWVLHGHRDGVPLLVERLRVDESDEVREMSAWALAEMRTGDVVSALADALKRDKSEEVRATAAWGLGQQGSRVEPTLLLPALDDASPDVRQRALWALGQMELSTAPAKVVALLSDERDEVRQTAAWVLSEILDKSTLPALRAAFLKERDSETLQAEFRALLFMGDRSQAVIDRAMNHEDPDIRARAVRMIAGQGPGSWPWPWPWPQPRPEP